MYSFTWASCCWWKAKVLYDEMWSEIEGTDISSKMSKMWVATYSAWVSVHFGLEEINLALDRLGDAINCCPMIENKTLFEHIQDTYREDAARGYVPLDPLEAEAESLRMRLQNEERQRLTARIYGFWSEENVNDEIACRLLATYAALLARSADYDTNEALFLGSQIRVNTNGALFLGIHDLLPRIFIRQSQGTGHEGTGDRIRWIDEICEQHGRGYGLGYPARVVWDANSKTTSYYNTFPFICDRHKITRSPPYAIFSKNPTSTGQ